MTCSGKYLNSDKCFLKPKLFQGAQRRCKQDRKLSPLGRSRMLNLEIKFCILRDSGEQCRKSEMSKEWINIFKKESSMHKDRISDISANRIMAFWWNVVLSVDISYFEHHFIWHPYVGTLMASKQQFSCYRHTLSVSILVWAFGEAFEL